MKKISNFLIEALDKCEHT